MNAALWGLLTALAWGSADFIARYTGRAMGHQVALLGMLCVGAAMLSLTAWALDLPLVWEPAGWWLLLITGVGIMVATLLLYWGLARGPVTVVAPIVGCYPALNVALAVALGARPMAVTWAAMGTVMLGVLVVARSARTFETYAGFSRSLLRQTILIAIGSAFGFAVAIAAAQQATPVYGELQTVLLTRWVSLAACALYILGRRQPVRMPRRWWPLLLVQGILDSGAYVALLLGSEAEAGAIAVVVASSFSAVTVILARLILREAMTGPQWGGIGLIIAGVAVLSA